MTPLHDQILMVDRVGDSLVIYFADGMYGVVTGVALRDFLNVGNLMERTSEAYSSSDPETSS